MMRKSFLKQCILVVLIFTLVSGGTLFAEDNTDNSNNLRMSFSDVPSGNWAEKHVSKLALLGISEGDHLGHFNPSQSVMQQDVIKMAVSFMGYTESDANIAFDSPQVIEFLNTYVDSYARPFVSIAFREGILDFNAEKSNINASDEWGRQHATREWVAKVVIHSINKENDAMELSNESTQFEDNLDISAWALGYVNAAVKLNIVNGFEDGEFKPTGFVTRAQIAAFLGKSEQYLTKHSDRVLIGTLTELTANSITVVDETGEANEYSLHNDLKYYSYKVPNDPISPSDVKLLYKVYLIHQGGTAYYLEIVDDELQLESTEGVLISKNLENINDQYINLLVDGKYNTYTLDSNVVVLNKDGSGSSLGAIIENSLVTIKRNMLQDNPKVLQIIINEVPVNKSTSGTVEAVNEADLKISLTDSNEGSSNTYSISDELVITYGNKELSGISELNAGDKVDYEIKNSIVTSIQLTDPIIPFTESVEGTIIDYNLVRNIITIENDIGEFETRRFTDNASVILKGTNMAELKDLQIDDEVTLLINGLNEVTQVEVLNREIKKLTQVEIFVYDPDTMSLVVTMNSALETFAINEDTVIEYGASQWDIDNFDFENIFVKGKKVDMTFSNNKLMEVKLSNYYDGNIKQINPSTRKITLTTENGELTFDLQTYTAIDIFGKTSASLADLDLGDSVRVELNASQSAVSQVKLKQAILYTTVSKNSTTKEITVKNQAGETSKFFANSNVMITHPTKAIASFSDIQTNEPLVVNYYGKTVISVEIPNTAQMGKVTNVNSSAKTFTLKDYNGNTKSFSWSEHSAVYVDGEEQGLNALLLNDRVNVAVDKDGNLFITFLEKNEKTFWKYVSSENKIYFNRSNWSDKIDYTLDSDVYLHENESIIQVSELKFLDPMIYYVYNGELVEVEKK